MKKNRNNTIFYLIFGAATLFFCLVIAGNLAFYRYENKGLRCLNYALQDMLQFKIHFSTEPIYLRYYLGGLICFALIAMAFMVNEEKYRHDAGGIEAGSAKWNDNLRHFSKKYADPIGKSENDGPMNMILSKHVKMSIEDRKTMRNNNVMVIGGAGTGKSRYLIKPNILTENCSFVCTDPSGELLFALGGELEQQGYVVKVFNLVNMAYSDCYNPFKYIRDDAGIGILVDCFIQNTTPEGQKAGDPFWEKSEKALLTACIYYLKDYCDTKDQNFPMVLKLVQMAKLDENSRSETKSDLDRLFSGEAKIIDGEYVLLKNPVEKEIMMKKLKDSQADKNYQTFRLGGVRTLKSILISAGVRLNPFIVPELKNLTKTDTIDLDSVGDRKTAMFVIIPQANTTYNFLVSMMYSQMFDALYYKAEHTKGVKANIKSDSTKASISKLLRKNKMETNEKAIVSGGKITEEENLRLKYHVRFMMDEFSNIGKIPAFPAKISTCRKYNISITVVLQSLAQIKQLYEDDYETILGNCDTLILLGTQEQTTAEYISKQLGKGTIRARNVGLTRGSRTGNSLNYQQTGRELMTIDEIRTMDNAKCLVFVRGEQPFFDDKYDLKQHPRYQFTGDYSSTYNYDITDADRFLNFDNTTYAEAAIEKEEPEEASKLVSKPIPVAEVKITPGTITEADKDDFRRYIMKSKAVIDENLKKDMISTANKAVILCMYDAMGDFRVMQSFAAKAFDTYKRPAVLLCNSQKEGFVRGVFADPRGEVRTILQECAYNNIHAMGENRLDVLETTTLFIVDGIKLEDVSMLKDALHNGKVSVDMLEQQMESIYDSFGLKY